MSADTGSAVERLAALARKPDVRAIKQMNDCTLAFRHVHRLVKERFAA